MKSLKLKSVLLSLVTIFFFSFFFTSCEKAVLDTNHEEALEEVQQPKQPDFISTYKLPESMNGKSDEEISAFVDGLNQEELSNLSVKHSVESNDSRDIFIFDENGITIVHTNCVTTTQWIDITTPPRIVNSHPLCGGNAADVSKYKMVCMDKDGNITVYYMIVITCLPPLPPAPPFPPVAP